MKTAFLFPGQGSQALGMLSESADAVAGTFEEASEALGYDLWSLIQQGPVEQLNQTEYTQPALLTVSVALWRLWAEAGGRADFVAGHSLGEYSALGCQQCFIAQRWRARCTKKRPINAGRRPVRRRGHGGSDGPGR